jgi:hypothetical protein
MFVVCMEESLERRTKMVTMIKKRSRSSEIQKKSRPCSATVILLQYALHFLKAKHDALDENHHSPRKEDSLITPVAVSFSLFFAFCRCDIESLAVLAQTPCPAARAHAALVS